MRRRCGSIKTKLVDSIELIKVDFQNKFVGSYENSENKERKTKKYIYIQNSDVPQLFSLDMHQSNLHT